MSHELFSNPSMAKKTKTICFSIQQPATVTWTAHATVPETLDLEDADAVAEWLENNPQAIRYKDDFDDVDYDGMDYESVEGIEVIE